MPIDWMRKKNTALHSVFEGLKPAWAIQSFSHLCVVAADDDVCPHPRHAPIIRSFHSVEVVLPIPRSTNIWEEKSSASADWMQSGRSSS